MFLCDLQSSFHKSLKYDCQETNVDSYRESSNLTLNYHHSHGQATPGKQPLSCQCTSSRTQLWMCNCMHTHTHAHLLQLARVVFFLPTRGTNTLFALCGGGCKWWWQLYICGDGGGGCSLIMVVKTVSKPTQVTNRTQNSSEEAGLWWVSLLHHST